MKKIFTILAFFLIVFNVKAQSFHPFPPDYSYQFSYAEGDSLYIIKADSVSESGEVFFNPVININDNSYSYYRLDSNNIFGQKLLPLDDGYAFISVEKDTVFVKPNAALNTPYKFSDGVEATNVSKEEGEFLGISDLVVTIELSTGETIKVSENYGLIKAYNFMEAGEKVIAYTLSAIPEASLGDYFYDPFVLYNYEVGDVRGYVHYKGATMGPNCPNDDLLYTSEVIDKEVYQDSIVYRYKVVTKVDVSEWCGGEDSVYTREVREVIKKEENNKVASSSFNFYPSEYDHFGKIHSGIGKSVLGMQSELHGEYTLYEGKVEPVIDVANYTSYVKGLGLVERNEYGSSFYEDHMYLVCFNNSTGSYGNCDSLMSVITNTVSKKVAQQISLTPNPATNYINVSVPEKVSYQITNTSGAVVKGGILYKEEPLSVESLDTGLYMIKLTSDSNVYQQRFVKK